MPNNFYNFMFKRASKEEEDRLLLESKDLIKSGVKDFLEGVTKTYPKKNINERMIDVVYHIIYPYYANYLTKKISIEKDKCINCKMCEMRCPVQSIKIKDKVTFKKDCLLCQRCMNSCPREAFVYKGKGFIQYNPDFDKFK
ncbi:hypothetical protein SDC9_154511 [bioreactor metagenome]|uniref:4Fe-4S ferredoxin-type domain-containing protein n=2 Tax=root TaxID=1 RepID=A0A645EYW5_9ZZZZ